MNWIDPSWGFGIGVGTVILCTGIIAEKLGAVANQLGQITEHLRIIRQHEMPAAVRSSDAIVDALHDPLWKRRGD